MHIWSTSVRTRSSTRAVAPEESWSGTCRNNHRKRLVHSRRGRCRMTESTPAPNFGGSAGRDVDGPSDFFTGPHGNPSYFPRSGAVLFTTGLILIALGFVFVAEEYNLIFNGNGGPYPFREIELLGFGYSLLTGIGILLGGVGWALDQWVGTRGADLRYPHGRRRGGPTGLAVVLSGAVLIASANFYTASMSLAAYLAISFSSPDWTIIATQLVLAGGVLLVAVGWLSHRLFVLARSERGTM